MGIWLTSDVVWKNQQYQTKQLDASPNASERGDRIRIIPSIKILTIITVRRLPQIFINARFNFSGSEFVPVCSVPDHQAGLPFETGPYWPGSVRRWFLNFRSCKYPPAASIWDRFVRASPKKKIRLCQSRFRIINIAEDHLQWNSAQFQKPALASPGLLLLYTIQKPQQPISYGPSIPATHRRCPCPE